MAKDVDFALKEILSQHGSQSLEQATEYFMQMSKKNYLRYILKGLTNYCFNKLEIVRKSCSIAPLMNFFSYF